VKTIWYVKVAFVALLLVASGLVLTSMLPAEAQPTWLKWATERHLTKGLDLQGGVRLVYSVGVDQALRDKRDRMATDMREYLVEKAGVKDVSVKWVGDTGFKLVFKNKADLAKLDNEVLKRYRGAVKEEGRNKAEGTTSFELTDEEADHTERTTYEQAIKTISTRIDNLGLRETTVTQRGGDISIEIPGQEEQQRDRIKRIISQTARLEFRIADDGAKFFVDNASKLPPDGSIKLMQEKVSSQRGDIVSYYLEARSTKDRTGRSILRDFLDTIELPDDRVVSYGSRPELDEKGNPTGIQLWRTWYLEREARVTGEYIDDARVAVDPDTNNPYVALSFNQRGAQLFDEVTKENVKRRMAIVLDDKVDSAPQIRERIGGGRAQINLGGYKDYNTLLKEAGDLVVVLKAGSLPAPVNMAHETIIGPALGRDAIRLGELSILLGGLLILLLMPIYYKLAGVFADAALVLNLFLLMAIMSAFEATLTLPGIAGIVLTVGMAVDANVIIYERIREELRAGKSPRSAVDTGYARAFWTIFDAQITTFIAGVVLLQYGTGPIKGFAVTLLIGIVTSMFTGIFVSRIFFDLVVERKKAARVLSI
jgi:preprotein translocase subunit SecD